MGMGGGDSGSPPVQSQNNVSTSTPRPWADQAVQGMLARATALAEQPLDQYSGQRIAPLTPTHNAALEAGRQMAFDPNGPLAQSIGAMQRFSSGEYNQPAFVHPFLGPPVTQFPGSSQVSPEPWGMGAGGGSVGGAGSPFSVQMPGAAAPIPAAVQGPGSVSAMPAGFDAAAWRQAKAAQPQADTAQPASMWGRGATEANFNASNTVPQGDPNIQNPIDQRRWDQFLGVPYGMPEGAFVTPGTHGGNNAGYMSQFNRDDRPGQYEYENLLHLQERQGGGEH